MTDKAKIAVVIPAYNAEKSIPETIECLLGQTLKELQIIVVDDGSKDNTAEVAGLFAKRDSRVLVVSKPNGGAYSARREALQYVKAEYLGFMDADDKAKPCMYEHMYDFAKGNDLEVVRCDIVTDGDTKLENEIYHDRESTYKHVLYPMLIEGTINPTVWNHIYRVPEGGFELKESNIMMGDDMVINLQFLKDINSYGRLHEGLYYYQINDGSSTRNFKPKNVDDFQENIEYRNIVLKDFYDVDPKGMVPQAWIVKNAFNNFKLASTAKAPSWSYRMENIELLLSINEIRQGVDFLKKRKHYSKELIIMSMAYSPLRAILVLGLLFKEKVIDLVRLWK